MNKIKKLIAKGIEWASENNFREFAVVCEICAVIFTIWALCSEYCFFWQEILFLFILPLAVWIGEKIFVFLVALLLTASDLFRRKTENR